LKSSNGPITDTLGEMHDQAKISGETVPPQSDRLGSAAIREFDSRHLRRPAQIACDPTTTGGTDA